MKRRVLAPRTHLAPPAYPVRSSPLSRESARPSADHLGNLSPVLRENLTVHRKGHKALWRQVNEERSPEAGMMAEGQAYGSC
jgi:hypothetical protein